MYISDILWYFYLHISHRIYRVHIHNAHHICPISWCDYTCTPKHIHVCLIHTPYTYMIQKKIGIRVSRFHKKNRFFTSKPQGHVIGFSCVSHGFLSLCYTLPSPILFFRLSSSFFVLLCSIARPNCYASFLSI